MRHESWVEPEVWYARLPTFYAAAAALLTNTDGRVLLVKPTYRDHWAFPGGYVEAGERPHHACAREVREELGLELPIGALLVIDWAPPAGQRPRSIVSLTFDAGVLNDARQIRLDRAELDEWAFLAPAVAADRLPTAVAPRVAAALRARHEQRTVYLPSDEARPAR